MTTAQLLILKNDILVTHAATVYQGSTLLQHWNNNNLETLANYYNANASPQVDLWRPDVSPFELQKVIVMSAYVALTAVKQNGFMVYLQSPVLDATNQNIRDGFTTIFGAGATLTALTALAKKPATNFENLFIGVIQSGAFVSSVYGQQVTYQDIFNAKQQQ